MRERAVTKIQKQAHSEIGIACLFLCDNWLKRLRGVYFRPNFNNQQAILLRRCSSVHGIGLKITLDVVFLDSNNVVLSVRTLKPNSVRMHKSASCVLEMLEGTAKNIGISVGDKLDFGSLVPALSNKKRKLFCRLRNHSQSGASMVEFLIVAPLLIYMGLGIVQLGLAYHARNVLDYATFEAARAGAVYQADVTEMRKELAYRLGAIFRGDGSGRAVRTAVQNSIVAVNDPLRTQIKIINPTAAAFEDFGVPHPGTGETVLPNAHLRHRSAEVGARSGVTIQDANLLKISVTHGYDLKFPWFDVKLPGVGLVLREVMTIADPNNAHFYLNGQIPLNAVATVRMQSMAKVNNVATPDAAASRPNTETAVLQASNTVTPQDVGTNSSEETQATQDGCLGEHGLPINLAIEPIAEDDITTQCAVHSAGSPSSQIALEVDETVVSSSSMTSLNGSGC